MPANAKAQDAVSSQVQHSFRSSAVIFAGILFLSTVVYLNADHQEFLFDSRHGNIKTPDLGAALKADLHSWLVTFWRPGEDFSRVTFRLNAIANRAVGLESFDVTGFLAVNVLVHAINSWLVYLLALRLLHLAGPKSAYSSWVALGAATWFAVHPLQANSVAYILQRRGTLSTLFFLAAVLLYISARSDAPRRLAKAFCAVLCYWLSVKSKFLGLPLPFVLLLIEYCLRARDSQATRRYLKILLPGLAVATIGMFLFAWSRGLFSPTAGIRAYSEGLDWTPWQHLLTESRVFLHYWKLLILPLPQWMCVDHRIEVSRSLLQHGAGVALLFHLLLIIAALWVARRGWVLTSIGLLWFYTGLIPYAVLPTHEMYVEYKTYLPSVGCALILAELLQRLALRQGLKRTLLGAGTLILTLAVATVSRNRIYHSPVAFWHDAVSKYPDDARINMSMGYSCWQAGDLEAADRYYRRSIEVTPASGVVHHYYAGYLRRTGRLKSALEHYLAALSLPGGFPRQEAHSYAGQLLQAEGRNKESIPYLTKAIEMDPTDSAARYSLGNAMAAIGDKVNAIVQYRAALQIRPNWPEILTNLGNALLEMGKPAEAADYYSRALELKPNDPHSRLNYSYALSDLGRIPEALLQAQESLRLDPSNPHAQAQVKALEGPKPSQ